MNKKEIVAKIEKEARKFFVGASGCHDFSHVDRVRNLALHIGKKEKADLFVLELAALLHDIGRKEEMESRGKFCHAEKGADLSAKILKKYDFDEKQKENIVHCVKTHRYRNSNPPETLEAKILFDADKLDAIGAVGVARDFLFAGNAKLRFYTGHEKKLNGEYKKYVYSEEDTAILEYHKKLKFIYKKILTKAGKEVAKERQKYMDDFFRRFEKEIRGRM